MNKLNFKKKVVSILNNQDLAAIKGGKDDTLQRDTVVNRDTYILKYRLEGHSKRCFLLL